MANNLARCSKIVPNDAYWKLAQRRFVNRNRHLLLERIPTNGGCIEHSIMQDGHIQRSFSGGKDCAYMIGRVEPLGLTVLSHDVAQIHA